MRFFILLIFILLSVGCAEMRESAERFCKYDGFGPPSVSIFGQEYEEKVSTTIDIGHGVKFYSTFECTSKGNGWFYLEQLGIKAYDGHGDGEVYIGGLASVYFIDLNDDGYKDLVICAAKEISGEREEFWGYRPLFFAYIYDVEAKQFRLTAGIFDPFAFNSYIYDKIWVEQRIVLDEKYRYNMGEISDKMKMDIDDDGILDTIYYSLKKDNRKNLPNIYYTAGAYPQGTIYCTIEMQLSKTNRTYFFSSKML